MSGAAVQTEPTTTRIHMMLNYPEMFDQWGGFSRLDAFLEKKCSDDKPPKTARFVECEVDLGQGVKIKAVALGHHIFIGAGRGPGSRHNGGDWQMWSQEYAHGSDKVEPFVTIEVLRASTKTIKTTKLKPRNTFGYQHQPTGEDVEAVHGYFRSAQFAYNYGRDNTEGFYDREGSFTPYAYLRLRVTAQDGTMVEGDYVTEQPDVGIASLDPDKGSHKVYVKSEFFGLTCEWVDHLGPFTMHLTNSHSYRNNDTLETEPLKVLYMHLNGSELPDGPDAWWGRFFAHNSVVPVKMDMKGLAAVVKQKTIKPNFERLQKDNPLDWLFFRWLVNGKTVDKKSNNSLLAAMLKEVGSDYDKLVKTLQDARYVTAPTTSWEDGWRYRNDESKGKYFQSRRAICLALPGAKEKVEEQEAKADWSKQKSNTKQAEALGITKQTPKLLKAVANGDIPTSVFRQPDKNPVNREFALWEKALKRQGWAEIIFEIAQSAASRGTYEKDISPYLAFLFRIETYLKKHSKRTWTAMPKFVQSQWELEMDEADEGGTTKKRSAFTPVADNETGIITVPYVAVSVSGVRTQWCYARHYHLFEEGFTDPESGGIVVNDLEAKLNGRDDYGLCFYTLTGTVTARGYPTFLIIFERLVAGTRVHFHRVRPQRSKDGRKTPACDLVDTCYQYMAGNVPASEITAQQGDLIFIKHPHDPIAAGAKVKQPQEAVNIEFESHRFSPLGVGGAMKLYESEAKTPKNRLGFLYAPTGLRVSHPEHDDIPGLVEGWWEIRRCRSWEANPKAIWSMTID